MLLMCKHTHTAENCGMNHPEQSKEGLQQIKKNLQESTDVEVVGIYNNNLAHTIYMLVKTENIEALETILSPILTMGQFEFLPVVDSTALFQD